MSSPDARHHPPSADGDVAAGLRFGSDAGPLWRWIRALFLPVAVALLVAAAFVVPLPLFVESPAEPASLAERVVVEDAGELDGDYLLMTVTLRRASLASAVRGWVGADTDVLSQQRIIQPGTTPEDHFERQRQVFRTAADVAAAVGLDAAGLDVEADAVTGEGALVVEVLAGEPADGVLADGDVIIEAGGEAVHTDADVQELLVDGLGGDEASADGAEGTSSGDVAPVELVVDRDGTTEQLQLTPRIGDPDGAGTRPFIGVRLQTLHPRVELPLDVEVDQQGIGGPSAGLMIALAVYDLVDDADLARGRTVAGTGSIDEDGRVRSIGGIRQKVVAADRFGVQVFFAPAEQLDDARAAVPAGSDLEVVGVAEFDEALDVLVNGRTAGGRP